MFIDKLLYSASSDAYNVAKKGSAEARIAIATMIKHI